MKNVTGAAIGDCTFTVTIKRSRTQPYSLSIRANKVFADGEEFRLNFDDRREVFSWYYGRKVGQPVLSKTCG